MFTKSSDMLNKNILGVKEAIKCEANKKQPYLCATKSFDTKKSPIEDVSKYLSVNDIQ